MESPNAPPAHDFFTPAWLKLPDPQVSKKSNSSVSPSSQSTETTLKRFQNNTSHRKELNYSPNSLSNGSVESRDRFNSNDDSFPHYLSSRHNSFGSEQQFNKPNPQIIGNVNGFRNKKYIDSSSRPPYRPVVNRDKPVGYHSNPNTKFNRNTDTFKPNFSSIKKLNNKSSEYSLDNESHDKSIANEENCNVFNQEFPSLVNNPNSGQNVRPNDNSSFHSAWSNPTKSKVLSTSKNFQLIHSSVANFDNIENSTKAEANGASSSKLSISSKYRNISLMGKAKGILKENAVYPRIQPMLTKTSTQTTTPAMEILVKNPKKRSNKSDFLNSIRNDQNKDKEFDKDNHQFEEKLEKLEISPKSHNKFEVSETETNSGKNSFSYGNDVKNAQNINQCNWSRLQTDSIEDMGVLSSSLEAEQRLLIELGWNGEPDDDDPFYAPITEDEVKEFKDLINARNGFKRNTTSNTTTLSNQTINLDSSPKKWPTSDDLDDESSSSSDDD